MPARYADLRGSEKPNLPRSASQFQRMMDDAQTERRSLDPPGSPLSLPLYPTARKTRSRRYALSRRHATSTLRININHGTSTRPTIARKMQTRREGQERTYLPRDRKPAIPCWEKWHDLGLMGTKTLLKDSQDLSQGYWILIWNPMYYSLFLIIEES
ncbi:hypothetical protein KM043_014273 [Ampulex compressa]|nr:hypothetical protein KM043_014273 [Ampulex compressa]